MSRRTERMDFRGIVEHRNDADQLITRAGEAVLVRRGVDRSLALACPDGCGEILTVNLDKRSGPAWRFYGDDDAISVFPSVWRTTGCKSHFIVWRSRIYWCDWNDELEATSTEFEQTVLRHLTLQLREYTEVADELGAVPWAVLVACQRLVVSGLVRNGNGNMKHCFRLSSASP